MYSFLNSNNLIYGKLIYNRMYSFLNSNNLIYGKLIYNRMYSFLNSNNLIYGKLIYNRMYSFLNSSNLIYGKQFGFRAKHSVNHALISTTELIKSELEDGNYVAGIFIDLEKAFDTVNHDILIQKLSYYGFRGNSQKLIKSFLTNRKQYVSINSFESEKRDVTCRVPQGSTLGPLLSLIYLRPKIITQIFYCKSFCR